MRKPTPRAITSRLSTADIFGKSHYAFSLFDLIVQS
jgi:hypothetical protein